MSGKGILAVGLAGAWAYWAYLRGYLPQLQPVVDAVQGGASHILPQELWGATDPEKDAEAAAIRDASGGRVVPILGPGEVVQVNGYEGMLRAHWMDVQPWARANLPWAAAIARVENAAMNPGAVGDNGHAFGVYQVHVPTAETCYRSGYTRYQPTAAVLQTVAGGVYFGTAEMDRLSKMGKPRDWIVKAYNGGAGWETVSEQYRRDREAYYVKVQKAFVALYGQGMV